MLALHQLTTQLLCQVFAPGANTVCTQLACPGSEEVVAHKLAGWLIVTWAPNYCSTQIFASQAGPGTTSRNARTAHGGRRSREPCGLQLTFHAR